MWTRSLEVMPGNCLGLQNPLACFVSWSTISTENGAREDEGIRTACPLCFLPVNIAPSFQVSGSSLLGPALNTTSDRSLLLPLTFQLLTSPLRSELIRDPPQQPYWSLWINISQTWRYVNSLTGRIFQKYQVNTLHRPRMIDFCHFVTGAKYRGNTDREEKQTAVKERPSVHER